MKHEHSSSAGGPNRATLLAVAQAIEPMVDEIVFVGGQVAELLITDPASVRVRPTTDVDVIVRATTRLEYRAVEERLTALGLVNDMSEGAPLCRWRTPKGHRLDVMPVVGSVLDLSSRWYPLAVATATPVRVSDALAIRIPSAPAYLATKWDAYLDRGRGDMLGSHDLEDIIAVVAGREEIVQEVQRAEGGLRAWLAEQVREFLDHDQHDYAVRGALPDATVIPDLLDRVLNRFEQLASLEG